MKILGIDYGRKRIGLAVVDTSVGVVLPFGIIENQESRIKNQELIVLIQDEKPGQIVVGLPLGLDGKENENTGMVRLFAEDLKKETDVSITFVDERFTTREAQRMGGDVSADEKAAMLILRSYVESLKS